MNYYVDNNGSEKNVIADESREDKHYRLVGSNTNPEAASNIIKILSTPDLVQMFSEEEVFRMKMYLKVATLQDLRNFWILDQKEWERLEEQYQERPKQTIK